MKSIISLIALFLSYYSTLYAQHKVEGTVTNDSGEILIGAKVVVRGTQDVCFTDIDGYYQIFIPDSIDKPVLEFDYLGYISQQISVSGKTNINVYLREDYSMLEEELVYYQENGIILEGGLGDDDFGAGIYFSGFQLRRYLHLPVPGYCIGEGIYRTDFVNNTFLMPNWRVLLLEM